MTYHQLFSFSFIFLEWGTELTLASKMDVFLLALPLLWVQGTLFFLLKQACPCSVFLTFTPNTGGGSPCPVLVQAVKGPSAALLSDGVELILPEHEGIKYF